MNVSFSYKIFYHVIHENYLNIEWLKITYNRITFKDNKSITHSVNIKELVEFNVTQ